MGQVLWGLVGEIYIDLFAEKISLLLDYDYSIHRETMVRQLVKMQNEILNEKWSLFIEDVQRIRKHISLTTFASLNTYDEFKILTSYAFLSFLKDIRLLMSRELIVIKYNAHKIN